MAKRKRLTVEDVEQEIGDWGSVNQWLLLPKADPRMRNPKQAMQDAVDKARVSLTHDTWEDIAQAARDLSTQGGVSEVLVVRVKHKITLLDSFKNGKSVRAKR